MEKYEELFQVFSEYSSKNGGLTVLRAEPMRDHTTFKLGGAAELFAVPENISALSFAVGEARKAGCPVTVLGKGSNVLFDDEGYRGVILSMLSVNGVSRQGNKITFGAGCSFTEASRVAQKEGLLGLSFAYGIPGTVGGAVLMNAGAYGGEVSAVLESSRYFDTVTGKVETLSLEDHFFGYRHSSYRDFRDRIILDATFALEPGDGEEIKAEMEDFMSRRREKQPLEYPSAGSTFKRAPGRFTAKMIDDCGLKGASVGGAQVSEKHAGFVINKNGATSADVKALIELIKKTVLEKEGVEIECEVITVGRGEPLD